MSGEQQRDSAKAPDKAEEQPGLPDPRSIVEETQFTSPKGQQYRILKTNERDAYDAPTEEGHPPGRPVRRRPRR
jgi:hypothetical protein